MKFRLLTFIFVTLFCYFGFLNTAKAQYSSLSIIGTQNQVSEQISNLGGTVVNWGFRVDYDDRAFCFNTMLNESSQCGWLCSDYIAPGSYYCYAQYYIPQRDSLCDPTACAEFSQYRTACTEPRCSDIWVNKVTGLMYSGCEPVDTGVCNNNNNLPNNGPNYGFSIEVLPSSQNVLQGEAVSFQVVLTPTPDGLWNTVNLSIAGCEGICTLSQNSIEVWNTPVSVTLTYSTAGVNYGNFFPGYDSFEVYGVSGEMGGQSGAIVWVQPAVVNCDTSPGINFMKGCLYDGMNFNTLTSVSVNEPVLSSPVPNNATPVPYKNWGNSGPDSSNVDTYSIRWKGTFNFSADNYIFTAGSDDGVRLYFDDNLDGNPDNGYIINAWTDRPYTTNTSSPIPVTAGNHTLVMEYYENLYGAEYSLSWTKQSVPASVTLTPSVNPINSGSSATLNWNITGATAGCTASSNMPAGNWSSCSGNCSGSASTPPLTGPSHSYSITCNPGAVTSGVTINVNNPTAGVTINKQGQGTVVSSPSGINCPLGCSTTSYNFEQGSTINLTATPSGSGMRVRWTGDCSGTNNQYTLVINSPKVCNVTFTLDPNYKEF